MKTSDSILAASLFCNNQVQTLIFAGNWLIVNRVSLLVVSVCLLLLVGCSSIGAPSAPISVESLCGLSRERLGEMDAGAVQRWVKEKYGTTPSKRADSGDQNSVVIYDWKQGKATGSAFLRNGHLFRIIQLGVRGWPTFGKIVDSLGPPDTVDQYTVAYERVLYSISLNYPKLGVSVGMERLVDAREVKHEDGWAVRLTKDMLVTSTECYTPAGSMEEIWRDIFQSPPEGVQARVHNQMPWPGFGAWVPLD